MNLQIRTQYVDQVHYDIAIFSDPSKPPIKTISKESGFAELYTASGQTHRFTLVDEPPGKYTYAIVVYGTGPEHILGGNPDATQLILGDLNSDGNINILDIIELINLILNS